MGRERQRGEKGQQVGRGKRKRYNEKEERRQTARREQWAGGVRQTEEYKDPEEI